MAAKKKTTKKATSARATARKKTATMKAKKLSRKLPKIRRAAKRVVKNKASRKKQTRKKGGHVSTQTFAPEVLRSGGQSGDLQGLSRQESADSESVEELLEEGNAFEADAVIGVEDAESGDEREVRTHEVPEDDVPGEYLDKD
jgi:hypothetical protein